MLARFWTLNQVTNFEPYGSRRKGSRKGAIVKGGLPLKTRKALEDQGLVAI